jgi:DNA helicase-4
MNERSENRVGNGGRRIGWYAARNAFYVVDEEERSHVLKIDNLRALKPVVSRLRARPESILEHLTEPTAFELQLAEELYKRYLRTEHPGARIRALVGTAVEASERVEARFQEGGYIRAREVLELAADAGIAVEALREATRLNDGEIPEAPVAATVAAQSGIDQRIEAHNQAYVRTRVEAHAKFFDAVERKPLSARQREAVVVEEDRHLVVAGAGSGKTSTIVARIAYLTRYRGIDPSAILVLAYNTTVKAEIRQRLAARGVEGVRVETYHAFGTSVVAAVGGVKRDVSSLANQPGPRRDLIRWVLQEAQQVPAQRDLLLRFLADHRYPAESERVYRTLGEYLAATRRPRFRTLDGRYKVRSLAEVRIADWLCRHGVAYEYEPVYHRAPYLRYRPDFYLPEPDLYLEHFGIDRTGGTAPHVDRLNYHKAIEWKRRLHRSYGTRLIETRQYERLEQVLPARLAQAGVQLRPRTDDEMLALALKSRGNALERLLDRFLAGFRENQWTLERVRASAGYLADRERSEAFLGIFTGLLDAYTAAMRAEGTTDFPSMIEGATDSVRRGACHLPYTHLVIDEFQDISHARMGLVRALLEQPGAQRSLFAVGDDWQSIYRYSGSDVSIMARFGEYFGVGRTTQLEETYRFTQPMAELSSAFILKNPEQLRKRLQALPGEGPAATLIQADDVAGLRTALDAIRARTQGMHVEVLVLTRYNLTTSEEAALRSVRRAYPDILVETMTIHKAKGTEKEYVVILGLTSAYPEFPSEQQDDPLLRLLVPAAGAFPDGEERRVFYVALTRAIRHVYLVVPAETPSRFVTELLFDDPAGRIAHAGEGAAGAQLILCPICQTGALVACGGVWRCTHAPRCDSSVPLCRTCALFPVVRGEGGLRCADPRCEHREPMCPRCGGRLIPRSNANGAFWGCSEYRHDWPGCYHTEPR